MNVRFAAATACVLLACGALAAAPGGTSPQLDLTARIQDRPEGRVFEVDLSPVRLRLDIVKFTGNDDPGAGKLLSTYAEAFDLKGGALPSLDMVLWKTKCRDDAMYAGLEVALQDGAATAPGKAKLLEVMLERVLRLRERRPSAAANRACAYVAAGMMAGGQQPKLPADLRAAAREALDAFDVYAKPQGFYTWSRKLEAIFGQDRFFQTWPGRPMPYDTGLTAEQVETALLLTAALSPLSGDGPDLRDSYRRMVEFYRVMTNPNWNASLVEVAEAAEGVSHLSSRTAQVEAIIQRLRAAGWRGIALFPHSLSRESRLFDGMLGAPPGGFMGHFIGRVESGEVSLEPSENSGYYDRQEYALETLLFPGRAEETHKLELGRAYLERLREAFKAVLTGFRETHIKQLPMTAGAPIKTSVDPRVEPLPTVYWRMALAYNRLQGDLERVLGREVLAKVRARSEAGVVRGRSVGDELRDAHRLTQGLYLVSCQDLGMQPSFPGAERLPSQGRTEEDLGFAVRWLERVRDDADLRQDVRLMIPIHWLPGQRAVYQWANVGLKTLKLQVTWPEKPKPVGPPQDDEEYYGPDRVTYYLPVTVWTEVATPERIYTRDEFRALCDRYDSVEAIEAALEGRFVPSRTQRRALIMLLVAGAAGAIWLAIRRRRRRA